MTGVRIENHTMIVEPLGWHKFLAFKRRICIPIEHVKAVRTQPDTRIGWWLGLRIPGTHIPGIIAAGSFYYNEGWVFWDVHDASKTVVIELMNEKYRQLNIEVADPEKVTEMIREAIA